MFYPKERFDFLLLLLLFTLTTTFTFLYNFHSQHGADFTLQLYGKILKGTTPGSVYRWRKYCHYAKPSVVWRGGKWLQTMFWDLISRTSIAIHCMAKMAEWFFDNILFWRSHIQGIDRLAKMTNDSEQEDRWSHYTLHRSSSHQGEIVDRAHKKTYSQTHDRRNTETHWPKKIQTHKQRQPTSAQLKAKVSL